MPLAVISTDDVAIASEPLETSHKSVDNREIVFIYFNHRLS